ncbi:MAG: tetratricopeptide repeat protein [Planctomycetota bacterium]
MKKVCAWMLLIFALLVAWTAPGLTQAGPEQTLKQYLSELQKNTNDYALRESIIRHVQTMRPAPAVPEDAERYMARGKVAFGNAKSDEDYNSAIAEFKKAVDSAPWLAAGYYNLGLAHEKAGQLDDAMKNFKLYLLADPSAKDAQAVKNRIYGLEYNLEQKAKAQSFIDKCIELDHAERDAEAVTHCKQAVKLAPKNDNARYNLGVVLRRQYGRSDDAYARGCREAIPEFEEAIRLGHSWELRAYRNLGNCYNNIDNFQKAISILEEGMMKYPSMTPTADIYGEIGYANSRLGNYEKAIIYYEKAVSLGHPNSDILRENISNCKQKLGR